jgi:hypothetical protein
VKSLAVAFATLALASATAAASASAHRGAPRWSLGKLEQRLEGATVIVGRFRGHVAMESTLCSGEGPRVRWNGVSHWRHFVCTWTTFTRSGFVARDVTFRVHAVSRTRFVITNAHFGSS